MPRRYLITPNVILNSCIAGTDNFRVFIPALNSLVRFFARERVECYMTDFDFYLAFLLPLVCGFNNCRMYPALYEELLENLKLLPIDQGTIEAASLYRINPTDAVRLAVAVENALDGIVTWEPAHFAQKLRDVIAIEREHKADIFVAYSTDEETGKRIEIRMSVSSVSALVNADLPGFQNYEQAFYDEPETNYIQQLNLNSIEIDLYSSRLADSHVSISVCLENRDGEVRGYSSNGTGMISTLFDAIRNCTSQFLDCPSYDSVYYCGPTSGRIDGLAQVQVLINRGDRYFQGIGLGGDLLAASASAYIDALNHLLSDTQYSP